MNRPLTPHPANPARERYPRLRLSDNLSDQAVIRVLEAWINHDGSPTAGALQEALVNLRDVTDAQERQYEAWGFVGMGRKEVANG